MEFWRRWLKPLSSLASHEPYIPSRVVSMKATLRMLTIPTAVFATLRASNSDPQFTAEKVVPCSCLVTLFLDSFNRSRTTCSTLIIDF